MVTFLKANGFGLSSFRTDTSEVTIISKKRAHLAMASNSLKSRLPTRICKPPTISYHWSVLALRLSSVDRRPYQDQYQADASDITEFRKITADHPEASDEQR